jgi:hypothetical protein
VERTPSPLVPAAVVVARAAVAEPGPWRGPVAPEAAPGVEAEAEAGFRAVREVPVMALAGFRAVREVPVMALARPVPGVAPQMRAAAEPRL